jgi:phosphoesterase RecJ-like protein
LGLKQLGLEASLACIDEIPRNFRFLSTWKEYQQDFDSKDYDAIVFMDCGDKRMTKFQEAKPEILSNEIFKINFDHHPTNDFFGEINFVNTEASSTCEITFEVLSKLGVKITPEIATALLFGLYTDTGGFVHQNTTPITYTYASELVKAGGNISKISRNFFYNHDLKKFKLWGKVLKNLHVTEEGAAIMGVYRQDYESMGASRNDLGGIIDIISSIEGVKYSVMLSEDEKNNVKGSLRTRRDDVDVKALAEKYGGGGHVKASGFTVPKGHLQKVVKWKIVQD